ncbi:MAG: hypothetical protein WCQ60_02105 [bacterium]
MIELFTAAAMLVSVYGPATATTTISATSTSAPVAIVASTTVSNIDNISTSSTMAFVKSYYSDEPVLIDIARCESSFRQYDKNGNILRGKVNAADIGVMQINEKYHLETAKSMGYDIRTTAGNLAYAKYLYDTQGADPWSASQPCWSKQIAMAK